MTDAYDIDPDARLSPEMAHLLAWTAEADRGLPDPLTLPGAEARALIEAGNARWNEQLPPVAEVRLLLTPGDASLAAGPRHALVQCPEGAAPGAILFAHGGGFAFGSLPAYQRMFRLLAIASGMTVIGIDYRLTPEHPFPQGLMDTVAAFRALAAAPEAFGVTPGPLLIGGDSAGANLALATILHEQALGRRAPDGALLFYGVYDDDLDSPSYLRFADGPRLTRARMVRFLDWYAPKPLRASPLAMPLKATDAALAALPPLYLNTAALDPLGSETLRLAKRLHGLGRDDALVRHDGVVHGFMQMSSHLDAAGEAITRAGQGCRAILARL